MPLESLEPQDLAIADLRWQARVDLAAAHRIAVMHGLHEGIFNHFTLRVPGTEDRYYQIPFGLHWSEVTASCFMEVGYDGKLLAGEGHIEQSCYCIHAPLHRLLPAAAAVLHTHMPFASALSRLEDPRILPIGQTELGTMMHTMIALGLVGVQWVVVGYSLSFGESALKAKYPGPRYEALLARLDAGVKEPLPST